MVYMKIAVCQDNPEAARDGRPTKDIVMVGRASVPAFLGFSYVVVAFRSWLFCAIMLLMRGCLWEEGSFLDRIREKKSQVLQTQLRLRHTQMNRGGR
jgi:hypothetical protein